MLNLMSNAPAYMAYLFCTALPLKELRVFIGIIRENIN